MTSNMQDPVKTKVKTNSAMSRQLIMVLGMVNLGIIVCSMILFYLTYYVALQAGIVSLQELAENGLSFHALDWLWLTIVVLAGTALSVFLGIKLAGRYVRPIRLLAEAANRVKQGDLSARVQDTHSHSSEISELMANFNDMAHKLEVSVKNAQVWNAAIAHELRTPMTILQGRLQGIVDGVFQPDAALMKGLLGQVEGLSHLVEDLRTLSLVENRQLRLNLNMGNLEQDILKCLSLFQPRLEAQGFMMKTQLTQHPCQCDSLRMLQALTALLDNALRYAKPGVLLVSTQVLKSSWMLQVEDEGPGISEAHLSHLFEPFYRLEESRSKEQVGTGLGLSVVQAIAEAHHGRVAYTQSSLGGSCFSILLPLS